MLVRTAGLRAEIQSEASRIRSHDRYRPHAF